MKYIIALLFFFFCTTIFSQSFTLSGKITTEKAVPISFANILIYNNDTLVTGTSSDENGVFEFSSLLKNTYTIKISYIGYQTHELTIQLVNNKNLKSIILIEDVETLDAVVLNTKRPTVTKKPDRLTFNVENTALTEGSTLQVLRGTPGVFVSEDNISVKGSTATIFINNKRVQLTSEELVLLLENSPANSIKKIEVITTPPASFDADTGVIINISMSKNLIAGYRGTIFNGYTQGVFPRYNFSTGHFFKNDNLNFNVNYSYVSKTLNREETTDIDFFDDNTVINQIWNSSTKRKTETETHNINLSFDYNTSKNSVLSISSIGLFTPYFKYKIQSKSNINDADNNFIDRFIANNLTRDKKLNIGTDLNFRTEFKNKSALSLNTHYTVYDYSRDQNTFQDFLINTQDSRFKSKSNQQTNLITAKADYNLPIDDISVLETGVKFSNINTNSDITRLNIIGSTETLDTANSNTFDYNENTFAAYINYNKSWEKWDLSLGLRTEHSTIKGFSATLNQTNKQNYFEFFPNLSASYNPSDNFSVYSNYKRSITRPNYALLNPFTFFLNENLIVTGNPDLQPAFHNHFMVGTTFLDYFTIEAYYKNHNGAINQLPIQDNASTVLNYTSINFDSIVDFGFDFIINYYPAEKWELYFATSFYNVNEKNDFGIGKNELNQWTNYTEFYNSFSLLKDNSLNLQVSTIYISKDLQVFQVVEDRFMMDINITKSILKKRGVLSLSVQDAFNNQDIRYRVNYLNQSNRKFTDIDNRFIKFGFRYKFGNTKLRNKNVTDSKEERDRLITNKNNL